MPPAGFLDAALSQLLPPPVRVASASIDDSPDFRHPREADVVARAVAKRAREFATGRRLAHALLDALSVPDAPLLPNARRAPRWPDGFVGTIAHCRDACVVAVCARKHAAGLGLDVEPARPLEVELLRRIVRDDERAVFEGAAATSDALGRLGLLAFVVKEAVYKALSADVGVVLEFADVRVDAGALAGVAPGGGAVTCEAELVRGGLPLPAGTRLSAGVVERQGLVLAGCLRSA